MRTRKDVILGLMGAIAGFSVFVGIAVLSQSLLPWYYWLGVYAVCLFSTREGLSTITVSVIAPPLGDSLLAMCSGCSAIPGTLLIVLGSPQMNVSDIGFCLLLLAIESWVFIMTGGESFMRRTWREHMEKERNFFCHAFANSEENCEELATKLSVAESLLMHRLSLCRTQCRNLKLLIQDVAERCTSELSHTQRRRGKQKR